MEKDKDGKETAGGVSEGTAPAGVPEQLRGAGAAGPAGGAELRAVPAGAGAAGVPGAAEPARRASAAAVAAAAGEELAGAGPEAAAGRRWCSRCGRCWRDRSWTGVRTCWCSGHRARGRRTCCARWPRNWCVRAGGCCSRTVRPAGAGSAGGQARPETESGAQAAGGLRGADRWTTWAMCSRAGRRWRCCSRCWRSATSGAACC